MFRSITAATIAAALILSPGVAHADPLDDAINSNSGTPGMVNWLRLVVNGDPDLRSADSIPYLEFVADLYCHPDQYGAVNPTAEFRAAARDLMGPSYRLEVLDQTVCPL